MFCKILIEISSSTWKCLMTLMRGSYNITFYVIYFTMIKGVWKSITWLLILKLESLCWI